jgi:DNA-binding PadR family transcriptional regulator
LARSDLDVTEHEGMLLALVLREQPITAYQLFKIYEGSPVVSINASKGQIYPAVRRLRGRGLLETRKVAGDARNTEEIFVTEAGRHAVRAWVRNIGHPHIVLDDPLRTRILYFFVLTRDEQLEFIAKAKALVKQRRAIVDEYNVGLEMPNKDLAYSNVKGALAAKNDWLDEVLAHVVSSE